MFRFMVYSLVLVSVVTSCMGQTFQYSRGWTNGKRSPSYFHGDPAITDIFAVPESDRRLENCIAQLQRFIHNPFRVRPSYAASSSNANGNANIRRQSNEIFEDLASSKSDVFPTKHN